MFLSIFAATCRPHNIIGFLDNLAETADDLSSFEVLLKLDEGADELMTLIDNYKKTARFTVKYLATPILEGYYSLDEGYNELLKIADPDTYFCWLLTDEIRFEKKGWDSTLKKYIGFYPDDIFRIKLSIFQLKNYYDFFECLPAPDNYAVTTRKWLEISDGWGHFWGPDSWHQCVDFFLGLCKNKDNPYGTWRSFPIYDIVVNGQEAGQGITDPKKEEERALRIHNGWKKHSSHLAQENFYRLALRLNAHIIANANKLNRYVIEEHTSKMTVSLLDLDNKLYFSACYQLPRLRLRFIVGLKKVNRTILFPWLYLFGRKLKAVYRCLVRFYSIIIKYISRIPLLLKKFVFSYGYRLCKFIIRCLGIYPLAKKLFLRLKYRRKRDDKKIKYFYDGKKLERIT